MPTRISEIVQHLHRAALRQDQTGLTDGQLLERFLDQRDDAAIAALVRRHGPMVWGVCRRVLRNDYDAEDAFQAAFLVLVRKAGSIMPREMVGNWLYGVARQTARKARALRTKRQTRETQVTDLPETEAPRQGTWRDLRPVLDQELGRLPDKYRIAIVLCDLEGRTRKEAARQLGLPEGTMAGRLARGRAMLAKRLARSGLLLSGGSLAAVLAEGAASAGVPAGVIPSAIKATTLYAAGQAAAGLISSDAAALAGGVLKTMLLAKLKVATAVLFLVGFSALTCGIMAQGQRIGREAPGKERGTVTPQVARKRTPKDAESLLDGPIRSCDELRGKWTGEKNGVKVDLTFNGKETRWQAHWQVSFTKYRKPEYPYQSPQIGVGIGAELRCADDGKTGRLNLYLPAYLGDNKEIKQSARGGGKPVGEVQRGAEGTIQLRIIPTGYEDTAHHTYDYPAVKGLILRRSSVGKP